MTLYERFQRFHPDLSDLGLIRRAERGAYFCTPVGAEIIGWTGVDGIHFCFVPGFGETVFAVSPMNPPGRCVHAVARSFEDLLRLLLACGDMAALEQAWQWDEAQFDGFLRAHPPGPAQRAALDALRRTLALTPMERPYACLIEAKEAVREEELPFSGEYADLSAPGQAAERPRRGVRPGGKVSMGIIGGADGPMAVVFTGGADGPVAVVFTGGAPEDVERPADLT